MQNVRQQKEMTQTNEEFQRKISRNFQRDMAAVDIQAAAYGMLYAKQEGFWEELWRRLVSKLPSPMDIAVARYDAAWEKYRNV